MGSLNISRISRFLSSCNTICMVCCLFLFLDLGIFQDAKLKFASLFSLSLTDFMIVGVLGAESLELMLVCKRRLAGAFLVLAIYAGLNMLELPYPLIPLLGASLVAIAYMIWLITPAKVIRPNHLRS